MFNRKLLFAVNSTLLVLFVGCGLLPSWLGGGLPDPKQLPPQTGTGEILNEATGLMTEFRWWMLLVIFFLPQARTAVSQFVKTVFTAATIPFNLLLDWYRKRNGG